MNKHVFITLWLSLAIAGALFAQQKAQIRIKKNINGVESQETREVIIDDEHSLEDVLRELNADPETREGFMDRQIEINILSEGEFPAMKEGNRNFRLPSFPGNMAPQRKPMLGVMLKESPCRSPKCTQTNEVQITEVIPQSPAAIAGLKSGDVILAINKDKITSSRQVIEKVHSLAKGGDLAIVVRRGNKKKKIKAHIDAAPTMESERSPFNLLLGPDSITMFNLPLGDSLKIIQPFNLSREGFTGSETAFLGVTPSGKPTTAGVSIQVETGSPAEAMGLLDDDIILELNGEVIGDFEMLSAAVRKCKPESPAELLILRDGKEKRITGTLGKRKQSASNDLQIFHDFKGMDDEGNYFYDFEFNLDAEDLQQQMEQLFRGLNNNPSVEGFRLPNSDYSSHLLRLEDVDTETLQSLALSPNSLQFEQLSLVPQVARGSIDVEFALLEAGPVSVQLKDREGHTLLYDEKQLAEGNYKRSLELAPYPTGSYFIIIEQSGKSFVKQIVKYKS